MARSENKSGIGEAVEGIDEMNREVRNQPLKGALAHWPAPKRLPWLLLISALIVAADRWTKNWVAHHIRIGAAIPVIPRVLRITHWTNEGAAFSLFADSASPHTVRWALIVFTLIAAIAVLIALVRLGNRITLATLALAFILGGAIGNVHDRIAYGSVVDFIEVHIFTYHWPDFNVADSAVVTGACLLFLDSLLPKNRGRATPASENRSPGTPAGNKGTREQEPDS